MSKIFGLGFNGFDQFPAPISTVKSSQKPSHESSRVEQMTFTGIAGPCSSQKSGLVHRWPSTLPSPTRISICWDGLCFITSDGAIEFSGFQLKKSAIANITKTDAKKSKYVDVACTTTHVAMVTSSGRGQLFAWFTATSLYDGGESGESTGGLVQANKIYEFNPAATSSSPDGVKMKRCFVGDQDAVFLSEAGRSVWLSLRGASMFEPQILPIGGKVTHASCGKEHVVLLVADAGTVYSFGQGSRGQLGHGVLSAETDPRLVECLEGIRIVALEAGGWHSAAVSAEGDLYTWGWNESGQLGFPVSSSTSSSSSSEVVTVQATPKCVVFGREIFVVSIACGCRHTAIMTSNQSLWTFGWNAHGQLGFVDPRMTGSPTDISSLFPNCREVRCGGWNTVVRTS